MNMKKFIGITLSLLLLCIAVLGFGINVYVNAETDKDLICSGVLIDSVDVSGMTKEQAKEAVDQYVNELGENSILINVDGNNVTSSLSELGLQCAENDYIDKALKVGKTGNLIKRYKEIKDTSKENLVFNLELSFDDEVVKNFVEDQCAKYDVDPVNATLKRVSGEFIVTNETVGKKVNVEETTTLIKNSILTEWDHSDITVEAVVEQAAPEYTSDLLKRCKDKIGTFSTTYGDSSSSRASNLSNGAHFINASVLYPGETFSAYEHMNPFTTENGYSIAGAYLNGQVVDSIGGGVCQVSTTLYNAVLLAELEIVQRMPHSMIVGYVKPAMDAAIAGTYKDLKFKNNTEVPIYIEGYTHGRTITFTIYGEETRPENRTVKYVSEITKTISPGKEIVTKDKKQPTTYRKVTQKAHTGYVASLYKIIYVDGDQISKDLINTSKYSAEPQYVTVGTKEVEEEEEDKDKDKDKDKEEDAEETETEEGQPTQTPVTVTPPPVEVTPAPTPVPVPAA